VSFIREQVVKRVTRSSGWNKVRTKHIKYNNFCAVCGKVKGLEVHHKESFKDHPELELDPKNLITLCRRHHFFIGHLENWKCINIEILFTVQFFSKLLREK